MLSNVTGASKAPPRELTTARLVLRAPDPRCAPEVATFLLRNASHFAPWDPPRPGGYESIDQTASRLDHERIAFGAGLAWRYWISPSGSGEVIGQCHISAVQRGPFQSALLGYGLHRAMEGRGLMTEALREVTSHVFSERVWLHRLQAAVRPENVASRRVLQRLGFVREGCAPGYLFIDGAWRDHEIFSLLNPAWPPGLAP